MITFPCVSKIYVFSIGCWLHRSESEETLGQMKHNGFTIYRGHFPISYGGTSIHLPYGSLFASNILFLQIIHDQQTDCRCHHGKHAAGKLTGKNRRVEYKGRIGVFGNLSLDLTCCVLTISKLLFAFIDS